MKTRKPTIDPVSQTVYWESQHKRRHPSDPIIAAFAQPKIDYIMRHISLPPAARILDVGCGNGYFTYYLEQYGQTIGVDYASAMLHQHPGTHLAQASAFDLPFADDTFDMVFCSNLLHHLPNPAAVVVEMKRVSRQFVVLHEPNRNNPAILALAITNREERQCLQFSGAYLRSLAERAGLHIIACDPLGFITPNRMPRLIAGQVGRWNAPHPLAAYRVLVARQ